MNFKQQTRRRLMGRSFLVLASAALFAGPAVADPPTEPRWSVVLSTAPHHPQDVWFTATGNNVDGWHSGGCICIGPLAQGLGPGDHATALIDIVEGGVVGIDGLPVPPGTYFAPGIPEPLGPKDGPGAELPGRDFDVTVGETFYVLGFMEIVESNLDRFGLPRGAVVPVMFTFDFDPENLGRSEALAVIWTDVGIGFMPFLNEGLLMTNVRLHP